MRVLIVAHVGETFGHVVKALGVADALRDRGADVEIACAARAQSFVRRWAPWAGFHGVNSEWSHNGCSKLESYALAVLSSMVDIGKVVETVQPDVIVSFPGLITVQVARRYGVRHISVLHGPYLAPLTVLDNPSAVEKILLQRATACLYEVCRIWGLAAHQLNLEDLDYHEFFQTEEIVVAQPGLTLQGIRKLVHVGFVQAGFGENNNLSEEFLARCCYITFGTAGIYDLARIVSLAAKVFPAVLVTGWSPTRDVASFGEKVCFRQSFSSTALAGLVPTVISHGGIGTVGTFAAHGTNQMIVPTEMDQAFMAMHARRGGFALSCGLESFVERDALGRAMPLFSESDFLAHCEFLRDRPKLGRLPGSGAEEIARLVVKGQIGSLAVREVA